MDETKQTPGEELDENTAKVMGDLNAEVDGNAAAASGEISPNENAEGRIGSALTPLPYTYHQIDGEVPAGEEPMFEIHRNFLAKAEETEGGAPVSSGEGYHIVADIHIGGEELAKRIVDALNGEPVGVETALVGKLEELERELHAHDAIFADPDQMLDRGWIATTALSDAIDAGVKGMLLSHDYISAEECYRQINAARTEPEHTFTAAELTEMADAVKRQTIGLHPERPERTTLCKIASYLEELAAK